MVEPFSNEELDALISEEGIARLLEGTVNQIEEFCLRLLITRHAWSVVTIYLTASRAPRSGGSKPNAEALVASKKHQCDRIDRWLDAVMKYTPTSDAMLALKAIALVSPADPRMASCVEHVDVIRGRAITYILEWITAASVRAATTTADEGYNQWAPLCELWDVVLAVIVLGASDVWSQTRKTTARRVSQLVAIVPLPAVYAIVMVAVRLLNVPAYPTPPPLLAAVSSTFSLSLSPNSGIAAHFSASPSSVGAPLPLASAATAWRAAHAGRFVAAVDTDPVASALAAAGVTCGGASLLTPAVSPPPAPTWQAREGALLVLHAVVVSFKWAPAPSASGAQLRAYTQHASRLAHSPALTAPGGPHPQSAPAAPRHSDSLAASARAADMDDAASVSSWTSAIARARARRAVSLPPTRTAWRRSHSPSPLLSVGGCAAATSSPNVAPRAPTRDVHMEATHYTVADAAERGSLHDAMHTLGARGAHRPVDLRIPPASAASRAVPSPQPHTTVSATSDHHDDGTLPHTSPPARLAAWWASSVALANLDMDDTEAPAHQPCSADATAHHALAQGTHVHAVTAPETVPTSSPRNGGNSRRANDGDSDGMARGGPRPGSLRVLCLGTRTFAALPPWAGDHLLHALYTAMTDPQSYVRRVGASVMCAVLSRSTVTAVQAAFRLMLRQLTACLPQSSTMVHAAVASPGSVLPMPLVLAPSRDGAQCPIGPLGPAASVRSPTRLSALATAACDLSSAPLRLPPAQDVDALLSIVLALTSRLPSTFVLARSRLEAVLRLLCAYLAHPAATIRNRASLLVQRVALLRTAAIPRPCAPPPLAAVAAASVALSAAIPAAGDPAWRLRAAAPMTRRCACGCPVPSIAYSDVSMYPTPVAVAGPGPACPPPALAVSIADAPQRAGAGAGPWAAAAPCGTAAFAAAGFIHSPRGPRECDDVGPCAAGSPASGDHASGAGGLDGDPLQATLRRVLRVLVSPWAAALPLLSATADAARPPSSMTVDGVSVPLTAAAASVGALRKQLAGDAGAGACDDEADTTARDEADGLTYSGALGALQWEWYEGRLLAYELILDALTAEHATALFAEQRGFPGWANVYLDIPTPAVDAIGGTPSGRRLSVLQRRGLSTDKAAPGGSRRERRTAGTDHTGASYSRMSLSDHRETSTDPIDATLSGWDSAPRAHARIISPSAPSPQTLKPGPTVLLSARKRPLAELRSSATTATQPEQTPYTAPAPIHPDAAMRGVPISAHDQPLRVSEVSPLRPLGPQRPTDPPPSRWPDASAICGCVCHAPVARLLRPGPQGGTCPSRTTSVLQSQAPVAHSSTVSMNYEPLRVAVALPGDGVASSRPPPVLIQAQDMYRARAAGGVAATPSPVASQYLLSEAITVPPTVSAGLATAAVEACGVEFVQLLSAILQQCIWCATSGRWELRRMATQVLPLAAESVLVAAPEVIIEYVGALLSASQPLTTAPSSETVASILPSPTNFAHLMQRGPLGVGRARHCALALLRRVLWKTIVGDYSLLALRADAIGVAVGAVRRIESAIAAAIGPPTPPPETPTADADGDVVVSIPSDALFKRRQLGRTGEGSAVKDTDRNVTTSESSDDDTTRPFSWVRGADSDAETTTPVLPTRAGDVSPPQRSPPYGHTVGIPLGTLRRSGSGLATASPSPVLLAHRMDGVPITTSAASQRPRGGAVAGALPRAPSLTYIPRGLTVVGAGLPGGSMSDHQSAAAARRASVLLRAATPDGHWTHRGGASLGGNVKRAPPQSPHASASVDGLASSISSIGQPSSPHMGAGGVALLLGGSQPLRRGPEVSYRTPPHPTIGEGLLGPSRDRSRGGSVSFAPDTPRVPEATASAQSDDEDDTIQGQLAALANETSAVIEASVIVGGPVAAALSQSVRTVRAHVYQWVPSLCGLAETSPHPHNRAAAVECLMLIAAYMDLPVSIALEVNSTIVRCFTDVTAAACDHALATIASNAAVSTRASAAPSSPAPHADRPSASSPSAWIGSPSPAIASVLRDAARHLAHSQPPHLAARANAAVERIMAFATRPAEDAVRSAPSAAILRVRGAVDSLRFDTTRVVSDAFLSAIPTTAAFKAAWSDASPLPPGGDPLANAGALAADPSAHAVAAWAAAVVEARQAASASAGARGVSGGGGRSRRGPTFVLARETLGEVSRFLPDIALQSSPAAMADFAAAVAGVLGAREELHHNALVLESVHRAILFFAAHVALVAELAPAVPMGRRSRANSLSAGSFPNHSPIQSTKSDLCCAAVVRPATLPSRTARSRTLRAPGATGRAFAPFAFAADKELAPDSAQDAHVEQLAQARNGPRADAITGSSAAGASPSALDELMILSPHARRGRSDVLPSSPHKDAKLDASADVGSVGSAAFSPPRHQTGAFVLVCGVSWGLSSPIRGPDVMRGDVDHRDLAAPRYLAEPSVGARGYRFHLPLPVHTSVLPTWSSVMHPVVPCVVCTDTIGSCGHGGVLRPIFPPGWISIRVWAVASATAAFMTHAAELPLTRRSLQVLRAAAVVLGDPRILVLLITAVAERIPRAASVSSAYAAAVGNVLSGKVEARPVDQSAQRPVSSWDDDSESDGGGDAVTTNAAGWDSDSDESDTARQTLRTHPTGQFTAAGLLSDGSLSSAAPPAAAAAHAAGRAACGLTSSDMDFTDAVAAHLCGKIGPLFAPSSPLASHASGATAARTMLGITVPDVACRVPRTPDGSASCSALHALLAPWLSTEGLLILDWSVYHGGDISPVFLNAFSHSICD